MTATEASRVPAARRGVLVVDDEPASQRAIRRALADEGRIFTAASAVEGLVILEQESVGLIVTDQRMPGMSGIDFLRQAVQRWPQVVRVVLTAYADSETVMEAINGGHVYFFLTKPWQPHQLRLVVRRGLERFETEAERVRLLRELEESYARVRREAEQKGRLLAMTAHELGTPVHILINAIALLRENELPPAARPWARMAAHAAAWMARGLAQVRNAVGLAQLRPRRQRVDLSALVRDVVTDIRRAATTRQLSIGAELPDDAVVVAGDRRWLRLAAWNLMSNAVRFTADGGTVCVGIRSHAGAAVLTVRDTGVGIAPEHLAEIFEPFSNAGGEVSQHASGVFAFGSRGLGLGLAIVKGIVSAHGGEVTVSSAPRDGTRVEVRLPLDTGAPSVAQGTAGMVSRG